MSAGWPLPDDVRNPDADGEYRTDDVDEQTIAVLSAVEEVRRRIVADLSGWNTEMARRMVGLVDEYAREVRDNAVDFDDGTDDDCDDDWHTRSTPGPDRCPTCQWPWDDDADEAPGLAEAARQRRRWRE